MEKEMYGRGRGRGGGRGRGNGRNSGGRGGDGGDGGGGGRGRGNYSGGGGDVGVGSGGGGGGRGRGRGGQSSQPARWAPAETSQQGSSSSSSSSSSGAGRGGRWSSTAETSQQGSSWSAVASSSSSGYIGGGGGPERDPTSRGGTRGGGRGGGGWIPKMHNVPSSSSSQTTTQQLIAAADPPISEFQAVAISQSSQKLSQPTLNEKIPIARPDKGGVSAIQRVRLLANHFLVNFNSHLVIHHYDIDIQPDTSPKCGTALISKSDLRSIKNKLFCDASTQFPYSKIAYDGEKSIYSAVELRTGDFKLEVPTSQGFKTYTITVKIAKDLELHKLGAYLGGNLQSVPREILQGMDLVMKEHPSRNRTLIGRNFYPKSFNLHESVDLGSGLIASRGFHHCLKPTSQGLALCVDYSVLAFRKEGPVLDFLSQSLQIKFNEQKPLDWGLWRKVETALRGLRVTVTHRKTKQKFTVVGLTREGANDIRFGMEDPEGNEPPREVRLVDYFRDKYGHEIRYKFLPCLDFSKNGKMNYVPMEYCVLMEGQKYPKESLDRNAAKYFKDICLAKPWSRKDIICNMVKASDGPHGGEIAKSFDITVSTKMTEVNGRVLEPPSLKLTDAHGKLTKFTHNREDCQWNLANGSVLEGKQIDRWGILDLTASDRYGLDCDKFIYRLIDRCARLRIKMKDPQFVIPARMNVLSNSNSLRDLLRQCNDKVSSGGLQILICVMTKRDPGYKNLKLISETEIGILTQCCLVQHANKSEDQYLANLSLKINAKLGGSNMELFDRLPRFGNNEHVLFIGADVNHPAPRNTSSPSIAAVVATMNWPAANKYASRIRPQEHRTEKIKNFGEMCLDLLNTYARLNQVKPQKIVVFRDGVSESQFDMVLNEELVDLKEAIYTSGYHPTITVVIAQKRHQTRLFPEQRSQGNNNGNVPPGTVVDTKIVHPWEFDFYLCSHYGGIGTSKATHYHVLHDEHGFTSDELQKLIYHMCFTFARCTKPVSLVTPVYYADIVAFRGQMYYEAMTDFSSSPSSILFDPGHFKPHQNLENRMFFC